MPGRNVWTELRAIVSKRRSKLFEAARECFLKCIKEMFSEERSEESGPPPPAPVDWPTHVELRTRFMAKFGKTGFQGHTPTIPPVNILMYLFAVVRDSAIIFLLSHHWQVDEMFLRDPILSKAGVAHLPLQSDLALELRQSCPASITRRSEDVIATLARSREELATRLVDVARESGQ